MPSTGITPAQEKFNKVIKEIYKNKEKPVYREANARDYRQWRAYTIEEIKQVQQNLDLRGMREVSEYYFQSSAAYRRIINFFSHLYNYYYTLDIRGASLSAKTKKEIETLYNNSLTFLDNWEIPNTFGYIAQRVLINGVFYGYITTFNKKTSVITELDPNYCRTRFNSPYGTQVVEFNMAFLSRYKQEEREAVARQMPIEIYEAYSQGLTNKWVILDYSKTCCFTMGRVNTPPLFSTIIDILNYEQTKDVELERDQQELDKILVQSFTLDENGDLDVLLDEMAEMHQAAVNMVEDNPHIDVLTTIADVNLKDTQSSTRSSTTTNIEKMEIPKYEGAGLSYELFGSTTATSLKLSLQNATSFMSQLIEQFSNWLSMITFSRFSFDTMYPIVTILPITAYNQKDMCDMYLKQAQYGYSWILPYVASGKRQSTILDSAFIEQDILKLKEKMVPLSSSFTESGQDKEISENAATEEGGIKELPLEEKSDKTIANENSI